jgi:hypothetical protein
MTPMDLHLEPLIAASYAMLLLVIAGGLEWLGRHSKRLAARYHTRGFRFRRHADHWECPTGARLERAEIDNELRVIRYRAPAKTCNQCPIKVHCTDSDSGREITVSLDPSFDAWLSTSIGRFHRGISLAVLILADLILLVELLRHSHERERWVLSATLLMVSLLALNLARGMVEVEGRAR